MNGQLYTLPPLECPLTMTACPSAAMRECAVAVRRYSTVAIAV